MRPINVIIPILVAYAIVLTLRLFARQRSSIRSTVLWILIWLSIGIFGAFPSLIDFVMMGAMMQNRMFFVFMVAILILFAMFFRQSSQNAEYKRQLNRLAQDVAVLRFENEKASKDAKKSGMKEP